MGYGEVPYLQRRQLDKFRRCPDVCSERGFCQRLLPTRNPNLVYRLPRRKRISHSGANNKTSPESATVIPMAHITVPRGQTFTLNPGAATDLPRLPHDGNQNTLQGPGADKCQQCSFFRLITSTCCGIGGSVGNLS